MNLSLPKLHRLHQIKKNGFPQLEGGGGTVAGKGKGIFTGGFEISGGTKVEIIRPAKS